MLNAFKIFTHADKESAAAEAGEYLNQALTENKNQPVLLMLSGGSSLALLDYVGKTALGPNLTITILDERFSQDPKINNFAQVQKTQFYQDALEAECAFFGTVPRTGDTIESLAERWEKNLRKWRQENPTGIIVGTLGMGADGHTGGAVPYPENPQLFKELFEGEAWVRAYDAGAKNQYGKRVTLTVSFFRTINIGIGFICGPEKKDALERLIKKQGETFELPALAWHDIADVKIFTDIKQ